MSSVSTEVLRVAAPIALELLNDYLVARHSRRLDELSEEDALTRLQEIQAEIGTRRGRANFLAMAAEHARRKPAETVEEVPAAEGAPTEEE